MSRWRLIVPLTWAFGSLGLPRPDLALVPPRASERTESARTS